MASLQELSLVSKPPAVPASPSAELLANFPQLRSFTRECCKEKDLADAPQGGVIKAAPPPPVSCLLTVAPLNSTPRDHASTWLAIQRIEETPITASLP